MTKKQTGRTRRSFSPEFKAEVVELVRSSGQSVTQIARELDLTSSAVRAWVAQADPVEDDLKDNAESDELKQLRAENKRLRMERDILVKATAFFVKEST